MPVRAEPTPQGAVIGTLSGRRSAGSDLLRSEVSLTGSQNGWARITLATAGGYSTDGSARPYGWIPADALTVDARVDGTITLYDRAGWMGEALATIEGDDVKFRVLGCRGNRLQVINARHGNVWIDKWCAREDGCRA